MGSSQRVTSEDWKSDRNCVHLIIDVCSYSVEKRTPMDHSICDDPTRDHVVYGGTYFVRDVLHVRCTLYGIVEQILDVYSWYLSDSAWICLPQLASQDVQPVLARHPSIPRYSLTSNSSVL